MPTATFVGPTSTTWTAPPGVTAVKIECWAQGRVGSSGTTSAAGAGGGGTAYAVRNAMPVTPGTAYTISFNGVTNTSVTGDAGVQCIAQGGSGQSGGLAANCTGDSAVSGGNGANAGALTGGNGGDGANGGGGGNGGGSNQVGGGGGTPGAGGGGAGKTTSGVKGGGSGGLGQAVFTWDSPFSRTYVVKRHRGMKQS